MPCFGHGHCLVGILHTVPTLTILQLSFECEIKKKMLDNVIGVTPAGFYCVKCGTPVGETTSAIRSHLNRCQPGLKDDLGEAHMVTAHEVQILKDKVNSSRRLPVEQHACSPLQQNTECIVQIVLYLSKTVVHPKYISIARKTTVISECYKVAHV